MLLDVMLASHVMLNRTVGTLNAGDDKAAAELVTGVQQRLSAKRRFAAITQHVMGSDIEALSVYDGIGHSVYCHYEAHKAYITHCGEWDAEGMPLQLEPVGYIHVLVECRLPPCL